MVDATPMHVWLVVVARAATMADLDELALAMPQATKELSDDGRPAYFVHGKMFCFHRGQRRDAIDPETGERLDDVLMFRVVDLDVKELLLAVDRDELRDLVAEAWLTRAQKRVAKAWLEEHGLADD